MVEMNATKARKNFYQLIADVNTNSIPVTITNAKGKNAVIISEDDWNALQETLYLNSIPGMAESILEAKAEPLSECIEYDEDEEW